MRSMPYSGSRLAMTRFVEVPMSVTVPPRMIEKASGMRTFDGLIFMRCVRPMAIGRKTAVVTVFDIQKETNAATQRSSGTTAHGRLALTA